MVEESSLRVHVAALRKVLAEADGLARCIVNVTGRGYTFVMPPGAGASIELRNRSRALPSRPARLIGREADSLSISNLLSKHRFVTIHGAGGIGKTTLALTIAHAQGPSLSGVCFVDLSLITGDHSVADAVATALGLVVRANDPTASILDFVGQQDMLIVLDSCEAKIAGAAALAEAIVQEALGVCVLTTSREPLNARDEHIYPLAPLAPPPENTAPTAADLLVFPAAQLFCERAAASGYRATLGDAEAVAIADICRKVDGNALAIELAAGRVGTYGLRQTADMLTSHLTLDWQGRRTAPARHQTLSAMLDWSYALIHERERDLLRELSVFVGPFGLREASAVAMGENIAGALEQLVLKSLVAADTRTEPASYRLLDTTRAYAFAKLQQNGMERQIRRRQAQCYLDMLSHEDAAGVSHRQLSNVRAALEWSFSGDGDLDAGVRLAAAASEYFVRLGLLTEGRRWSERALEALAPHLAGSRVEVELRTALGHAMMFTSGDMEEARITLEGALTMAVALADPALQFRLLSCLNMLHRRLGAEEAALTAAKRAVDVAALTKTEAASVAAQAMLGVAHQIKGNLGEGAKALQLIRATASVATALPHFYGFQREADSLLGVNYWMRGFPDRAVRAATEAMPVDEDDPVTACLCLMWRVILHHLRGDWDATLGHLDRVARIASAHGLAPQKWVALGLKGDVEVQCGDIERGMSNLRLPLQRLREGRYMMFVPWLTCCLADAVAQHEDANEALAMWNAVAPEPIDYTNAYMAERWRVRGAVLSRMGDEAGALEAFHRALEICDLQGALSWRLRAATSLAQLHLAHSRLREARLPLAETYARFTEGFDTRDLVATRALIDDIDRRDVDA